MNKINGSDDLNNQISTFHESLREKSIHDTIELYRTESDRLLLGGKYIKLSSGLILNSQDRNCKGHCFNDKGTPVVCGKLDNCNNFNNAANVLSLIKYNEYLERIDTIY